MKITIAIRSLVQSHPYWIIAGITFLIFIPVFPLEFWLIDDHEIALYLSALQEGGWLGFWNQWLKTPDFYLYDPSLIIIRFRPVYYFLRAAETLAWQDNVFMWSFTRATIAYIFAVSIFRISRTALPPAASITLALSSLCAPWVPDVLFRIGPSEAYAVLFVAVLVFSLTPQNRGIHWLVVVICVALLIGVKENFFVLLPLGLYGVFLLARERRIFVATLALCFVIFSIGCVFITAYKLYYSSGLDVYGQAIGGGRLSRAIMELFTTTSGWASLLILALSIHLIYRRMPAKLHQNVMIFSMLISTILFVNVFFYSGVPDIRGRYAFPYWPLLLGVFGAVCFWVSLSPSTTFFVKKRYLPGLILALVVPVLVLMMIRNISVGYRYTAATKNTDLAISQIIKKSSSIDEVIVVTSGPYLEPAVSLSRFLRFRGLTKPLFLSVEDVNGHKIELDGGSGYLPASYRGKDQNRCLEVVFKRVERSICSDQVVVLWEIIQFKDMLSEWIVPR